MPEPMQMYDELLQPSGELVSSLRELDGDILLLGAGGKMGPAMAKLAKQACEIAGLKKKIIAASRFSEAGLEDELQEAGIETMKADLLNEKELQSLPDVQNVLYLAGTKFGTKGRESFTWAMNAYLPGRVAEKYSKSRIVVFSTGNVYPLTRVAAGGATENQLPSPIGEYAQSCLGRERIFEYHSIKNNTPLFIYRLNYANDVHYGVLLEIGKSVKEGKPIDLSMGHVNVIWQGDANEIAIRAFLHCSIPPRVVNIAGPETVSVRWLALEFGKLFNSQPVFSNEENDTALLSNAAECFKLFGYPRVPLKKMIEIIALWIQSGGKMFNKETHFQERHGQF